MNVNEPRYKILYTYSSDDDEEEVDDFGSHLDCSDEI